MKTTKTLFKILVPTLILTCLLTGCGSKGQIIERTTDVTGGGGPETQSGEHDFMYSVETDLKTDWTSVKYLGGKEVAHPDGPELIRYTVRFEVKGEKKAD